MAKEKGELQASKLTVTRYKQRKGTKGGKVEKGKRRKRTKLEEESKHDHARG